MNVLSLFDGMSCGQIALNRCGFHIDNYYAAEIDKHAIKVTQANYPNTIQLGDVTKVNGADLPKIDLLIGGSPCQGFSFAGKQLNFEDPRSALFFEFVRLLEETKPKYFLLENVRMKKEHQDVISQYLGVEPIALNSNLVSAQNRYRLYWTNIEGYVEPQDKGLVIADITEQDGEFEGCAQRGRYNSEGKTEQKLERNYTQKANSLTTVAKDSMCLQVGIADDIKGHDVLKRIYSKEGKSPTLTTCGGGNTEAKIAVDLYKWRKLTPLEYERLQTAPDNYTNHVSNSQRYRMLGNGWTVDAVCEFFKHIQQDI